MSTKLSISRAPLAPAEISQELSNLEGWKVKVDATKRELLVKDFVFVDFKQAFAFISAVALCSEKRDHHPELHNVYNRVELALTTHDAGNRLTGFDFALAKDIDRVSRGFSGV